MSPPFEIGWNKLPGISSPAHIERLINTYRFLYITMTYQKKQYKNQLAIVPLKESYVIYEDADFAAAIKQSKVNSNSASAAAKEGA